MPIRWLGLQGDLKATHVIREIVKVAFTCVAPSKSIGCQNALRIM
jgi:hypothetical protein